MHALAICSFKIHFDTINTRLPTDNVSSDFLINILREFLTALCMLHTPPISSFMIWSSESCLASSKSRKASQCEVLSIPLLYSHPLAQVSFLSVLQYPQPMVFHSPKMPMFTSIKTTDKYLNSYFILPFLSSTQERKILRVVWQQSFSDYKNTFFSYWTQFGFVGVLQKYLHFAKYSNDPSSVSMLRRCSTVNWTTNK